MAPASRRSRRPSIDIWPGFVDALAQLLMVIIFMLLVFTAGQFLLSDALSGRDKALQELQQQLNELSDLLAIEAQQRGVARRLGEPDCAAQAAIAERDALTTRVAELAAKVDRRGRARRSGHRKIARCRGESPPPTRKRSSCS